LVDHCNDKNCDCKRHYNAKGASIGYGAYQDDYVYDYRLSDDDHRLLPRLASPAILPCASHRVDADKSEFDTTHDATLFHQMAHSLWQTEVFAPLNTTNEDNFKQVPTVTISLRGIPICREDHQIHYWDIARTKTSKSGDVG